MYVQCVRFRRELPADVLYSRAFHLAVTLKLTPVRLTLIFWDRSLDISLHIFVAEIRLRFSKYHELAFFRSIRCPDIILFFFPFQFYLKSDYFESTDCSASIRKPRARTSRRCYIDSSITRNISIRVRGAYRTTPTPTTQRILKFVSR